MTILAIRGNIIAADKMMEQGDLKLPCTKLLDSSGLPIRSGDKYDLVFGITGDLCLGYALAEWFINGADKFQYPIEQKTDHWTRLVVARKDRIEWYEQFPYPIMPDHAPYFAFGSGRDYAMGAMAHGASAIEAVKCAVAHCSSTGMGIDFAELV